MTTIILFAPLIGALICGFGWRLIGERAGQVITTGRKLCRTVVAKAPCRPIYSSIAWL
jgi:hypothetical protein